MKTEALSILVSMPWLSKAKVREWKLLAARQIRKARIEAKQPDPDSIAPEGWTLIYKELQGSFVIPKNECLHASIKYVDKMTKTEMLFDEEIRYEEAKEKPHMPTINRLKALKEKGGDLTFDTYISTGRFMPRDAYLAIKPEANLSKDCREVIRYMGGYCIMALKDNTFCLPVPPEDPLISKSLNEVEKYMWESRIKIII